MRRALPVRRLSVVMCALVIVVVAGVLPAGAQTATASKVTVGSPSGQTPRNHQNEPAVAIDAANPNVVVAGTNDYIDQQPCPRTLPETIGNLRRMRVLKQGDSSLSFYQTSSNTD